MKRVPWLEMLKHSGVIKDYEVTGESVKDGCPVMELSIQFLAPAEPITINGTMTIAPEHTKLSLGDVVVFDPNDQYLQQLDEDQGL